VVPGVRYERRVASGVLGMSVAVMPIGVRRGCVGGVLECCFLPYVVFPSLHGYGGASFAPDTLIVGRVAMVFSIFVMWVTSMS
jgi:hypothetical protein